MLSEWLWKFVSTLGRDTHGSPAQESAPAMHKAWPELLKRMKTNKVGTTSKDRQLVIAARTWFCLYLFEHQ